MAYRVEVIAIDWAGMSQRGWRPAIAGTLNQTGEDDDTASEFETEDEARRALRQVVEQNPDHWRIYDTEGGVICEDGDDDDD